MAGAEKYVALVINRAGPNVSLLSIENFSELWRKHQYACVADRNSARVTFQQFGAATGFPNSRLTCMGRDEENEKQC